MNFFIVALPAAAQVEFIPNQGQWEDNVLFRADVQGARVYVEQSRLTYFLVDGEKLHRLHHGWDTAASINAHTVRVNFPGANNSSEIIQSKPGFSNYNFFLGNNPSRWAAKVQAHRQLTFVNFFEGIDLELLSHDFSIKYQFIVKPNADAEQVRLQYEGADEIYTKEGKLFIKTSVGTIEEDAPVAWQVINGQKRMVNCRFELNGNLVSFSFGEGYNPAYELIIDPFIVFSTYSGSPADNFGFTATYDTLGFGYSGGAVYDFGFPTSTGAFQETWAGGGPASNPTAAGGARDMGIIRYTPDGSNVIYITYIGGSGNEQPHSMVVNNNLELVIYGTTDSKDFPVAAGYDETHNGGIDMVVMKLSADGSNLVASTYIGGSLSDGINNTPLVYNYGDHFRGEVVVDAQNNVYIASSTLSFDFPSTANAFRPFFGGGQDGVVLKFSPDLDNLLISCFVGGGGMDAAYSLKTDRNGNIVVAGGTNSADLPVDPAGYLTARQDTVADGFLWKLSADGTTLLGGTYIGTEKYDQVYFVELDAEDRPYFTGQTESDSFPVTPGVYSNPKAKQFIAVLDASLQNLEISTVFGKAGSRPALSPSAFLVDVCGHVFFSGWGGNSNYGVGTNTKNLPITPNTIQSTTDGSDFYIAVFSSDLTDLMFSTYFGGPISEDHVDGGTSRFDKNGVVYQSMCAGCGGHSDMYTSPNAWSSVNPATRPGPSTEGGCNNAMVKIDLGLSEADFSYERQECSNLFSFSETSNLAFSWDWDFGDGTTSTEETPEHEFTHPGTYEVLLVINRGTPCLDSAVKTIILSPDDILNPEVPNVFTPNGDGRNDFYTIGGIDIECHTLEFMVINRWGQKIYEVVNEIPMWDGTHNGVEMPSGTYFFALKLDGRLIKGTIALIREK